MELVWRYRAANGAVMSGMSGTASCPDLEIGKSQLEQTAVFLSWEQDAFSFRQFHVLPRLNFLPISLSERAGSFRLSTLVPVKKEIFHRLFLVVLGTAKRFDVPYVRGGTLCWENCEYCC